MTTVRLFSSVVLAGTFAAALGVRVLAADQLPDRRAVRPAASAAGAALGSDAAAELLSEIQELKSQLRELRGQIEVQGHQIEQMRNGQRQSLADIDRRVRELERRAATGGSATPAAGPGAATPAPAPVTAVAAPALPPTEAEQSEYDAAFALMKQGLYGKAAAHFHEFIAQHPKSALADNAQYWIGEAAYVTRDFRTALEEFSKVVKNYPGSPKVPDAMLKIGYTHYELAAYDRARQALNEVIARYPNTAVAKSAQLRLERMAKEGD